jgi:hypothetical protein
MLTKVGILNYYTLQIRRKMCTTVSIMWGNARFYIFAKTFAKIFAKISRKCENENFRFNPTSSQAERRSATLSRSSTISSWNILSPKFLTCPGSEQHFKWRYLGTGESIIILQSGYDSVIILRWLSVFFTYDFDRTFKSPTICHVSSFLIASEWFHSESVPQKKLFERGSISRISEAVTFMLRSLLLISAAEFSFS